PEHRLAYALNAPLELWEAVVDARRQYHRARGHRAVARLELKAPRLPLPCGPNTFCRGAQEGDVVSLGLLLAHLGQPARVYAIGEAQVVAVDLVPGGPAFPVVYHYNAPPHTSHVERSRQPCRS